VPLYEGRSSTPLPGPAERTICRAPSLLQFRQKLSEPKATTPQASGEQPSTFHRNLVILGAILLTAVTRTLPHPPNFAPMTALALFGAATLADKRVAVLVSLLSLLVSDLCIDILHRWGLMDTWGFYSGMWMTYTAFLLVTLLGFALRRHRSLPGVASATLAGSLLFFIVTNFAFWATFDSYPHTWSGLILCYTAAIPFFQNTLAGDVVYSTVLFGGLALAERRFASLREPEPVKAGEA
jgi:hypothetical protein